MNALLLMKQLRAIVFSIFLCYQTNVVLSNELSDMIKRGEQYKPIAKRTEEDFQKCQRTNVGKPEAEAVLMIEGNRLLLTCPLCLPPDDSAKGIWQRVPFGAAVMEPVLLDGRRSRVLPDLSLEISFLWVRDSGTYLCLKDQEVVAHYAVQVQREEPHRYVVMRRGAKKRGPSQELPLADLNLVIGMNWSEWSPCNRCGDVGRRRKVGVCTVRKLDPSKPSKPVDSSLFNEYRKGIPCRSSLLPEEIKNLSIVVNTKSEFVIGFCKIPCPSESGIVVVTDSSGKVLDTVDNSQGIYSMQQPLPPLPDLVKRRTLYEEEGSSVWMTCPANTEGKFFVWRNASSVINPSRVHVRTKGRVKIDLANNLIIRQLRYSDSAIYSCWDEKRPVGTIRLQVTKKALGKRYRIYILNLGVLFTFLVILMISVTLCRNVRLQTKQ